MQSLLNRLRRLFPCPAQPPVPRDSLSSPATRGERSADDASQQAPGRVSRIGQPPCPESTAVGGYWSARLIFLSSIVRIRDLPGSSGPPRPRGCRQSRPPTRATGALAGRWVGGQNGHAGRHALFQKLQRRARRAAPRRRGCSPPRPPTGPSPRALVASPGKLPAHRGWTRVGAYPAMRSPDRRPAKRRSARGVKRFCHRTPAVNAPCRGSFAHSPPRRALCCAGGIGRW